MLLPSDGGRRADEPTGQGHGSYPPRPTSPLPGPNERKEVDMVTVCPRCHATYYGWAPVTVCSCGWSSTEQEGPAEESQGEIQPARRHQSESVDDDDSGAAQAA